MDLELAPSKSARPDSRRAILRASLLQRRAELRKGWHRFIRPECLSDLGPPGAKVASFLSGQDTFYEWQAVGGFTWTDCDASLSECLISIGVGESLACYPSTAEPPPFSQADVKKLSEKARVDLLRIRYRCPLNIGRQGESDIAEELLRQLMVADRTKLERGLEFEADDVLLKLTLIAIRALMKRDLRFLDALNYFYELPQRSLARLQRNPHFLAAWLCIYAQLLCAPGW